MNNKFDEIFNKIINVPKINLVNCQWDCNKDIIEQSFNYNPIILDKLLYEAVDQYDLTPIPKVVLNYICSKIKVKQKSQLILTYQQIYQLLKNQNYQDCELFKKKLKQYNIFDAGYLTIGVCSCTLTDFQTYFKTKFTDNNKITTFKNYVNDSMTGNTFTFHPFNIQWLKNVCIFLNFDMIKPNTAWKDSLSHQLSHFIQRLINPNYNNFNGQLINAFILTNQQQKILAKLLDKISYFDKNILVKYWGNMLSQTLTISELKTTTQNILNGFQRMYQQQYIVNNKPKYRKFKDSQQKREQWLNNKLQQINDQYFFTTEAGIEVLEQFFGSSYKKLYSNWLEQKKFKDSVLIMQYLGIRNCIKDINIDERLHKHFQTFKFKDN